VLTTSRAASGRLAVDRRVVGGHAGRYRSRADRGDLPRTWAKGFSGLGGALSSR